MNIKLECIKEHPDGSATYSIDLDSEASTFLINLGLVTALREAIEHNKDIQPYMENK
jgi:hypothetical protein